MSILDFVNSPDIKDYLKEIDYKFSLKQFVNTVNYSKVSIEEKHKAYEFAIENYPDEPVNEKIPSIHAFLKEYVEKQREILDDFLSFRGEFTVIYFFGSCCGEEHEEEERVNGSIEDALESIKNGKHKWRECHDLRIYNKQSRVSLNGECKITDAGWLTFEENQRYCYEGIMRIKGDPLPTPFKKGDIILDDTDTVCVVGECFENEIELYYMDEFTGKPTHFTSKCENNSYWKIFKDKINENDEALVALSKYFKEEITLDEFLAMYEGILLKQKYKALSYKIPLEAIDKLKDYDCSKNEELIPKN